MKVEKYTGQKTYMFPNGAVATPEVVLEQFPAVMMFVHVVETDENGEVMFACQNLSSLRTMYKLETSLTEEQAIEAIEVILNTIPTQEPNVEERQAAALEMIAVNGMPDII